ncbi:MAG: glycosyltransferase family 2 protein, partial [Prevotella sp.]|nr:glycosyltransferase family 2 protein [Prevotella sp.]
GKAALERRIAQLTMDYLYNTIKLTHSRRHLEETMERLRDRGLYPLPDKNYTRKYQLFRKAIDTKLGRDTMLMLIR